MQVITLLQGTETSYPLPRPIYSTGWRILLLGAVRAAKLILMYLTYISSFGGVGQ